MFFEDLSPFIYYTQQPWPNVRAVGWLDPQHTWSKGDAPTSFSDKLARTMRQRTPVNVHACEIRGVHPCALCGKRSFEDIDPNYELLLGSTLLWMPNGTDDFFVAPSMIFHYATAHSYLPPMEFLEAIENFDLDKPYNGKSEYKRIAAIVSNA